MVYILPERLLALVRPAFDDRADGGSRACTEAEGAVALNLRRGPGGLRALRHGRAADSGGPWRERTWRAAGNAGQRSLPPHLPLCAATVFRLSTPGTSRFAFNRQRQHFKSESARRCHQQRVRYLAAIRRKRSGSSWRQT